MKNLTTPQAILCGFGLVALAITSIPYSSQIIKPAYANNGVQKIAICYEYGSTCVSVEKWNGVNRFSVNNYPIK